LCRYTIPKFYFHIPIIEYETTAFCGKIENESANDVSSCLKAKEISVALVGCNSAERCLKGLSMCSKILPTTAAYELQVIDIDIDIFC